MARKSNGWQLQQKCDLEYSLCAKRVHFMSYTYKVAAKQVEISCSVQVVQNKK